MAHVRAATPDRSSRSGRCRRVSSPISRSRAASTCRRSSAACPCTSGPALGGFHGRAFRAGDHAPAALPEQPPGADLELAPLPLDRAAPVRVVLGSAGRPLHAGGPRDLPVVEPTRLAGGRPDGLSPCRSEDRACPRLQHRLRRHRGRLGAGAGRGRADRHDGGSADHRRLSEDRDRDLAPICASSPSAGPAKRSGSRPSTVEEAQAPRARAGAGDRRARRAGRGPQAGCRRRSSCSRLNLAGAAVDALRAPWNE